MPDSYFNIRQFPDGGYEYDIVDHPDEALLFDSAFEARAKLVEIESNGAHHGKTGFTVLSLTRARREHNPDPQ